MPVESKLNNNQLVNVHGGQTLRRVVVVYGHVLVRARCGSVDAGGVHHHLGGKMF